MVIVQTIKKVKEVIRRVKNKKIGFVPTMGALHEGHLSLVRRAKKEADFVVVSIFVNPLQFGPQEDYKLYPRNFKKDEALLKKEGVNLIFYPTPKTMYLKGFSTYVEEVYLSRVLCGVSRPGHFKGVTTVVAKLFNIVEPDIAYFGQKDYQQAQIIKRMVRDLNFPIKIRVLPIVRDKDGLALSSRNSYLSSEERKSALVLFQSIRLAKDLVRRGIVESSLIIKEVKKLINSKKYTKIDYVEIVDPLTLRPLKRIEKRGLLALAVYVGRARLIDNAFLVYPKRKAKV
ncbi:MAG TPA: pantoate--beta-alanine ligase [Candidatus Omnitrophica bacterium]|nr:MAG: pantoate--beta-alanine ligase [Candidatus Omnitrophota bacterium]RKY34167.1 MAG: pantoate--beta-alanine ligase [Candidatus Omnitrophota bacterium]HEC69170.1 pantoate--beta-alanine ligase [Candidatus Omnitrophota bacterium]